MTKPLRKLLLACVLLSLGRQISAQSVIDARNLGMAGSNIGIAEGMEYLGGNPATLARRRDFKFELLLLSAHMKINNNSYSFEEYDRYFTTGDTLTNREVENLLSNVPDSGLKGDILGGLKTLSVYTNSFSLSLAAMGHGAVDIPKEAMELLFHGNKKIESVKFDDADGEGWGGMSINLGLARSLTGHLLSGLDFLSVGVTAKYVFGMTYGKLEAANGEVLKTGEFVTADGEMIFKTSDGGDGLAFDLGLLAEYNKKWTLSLHCNNLIGGIRWNDNNQMHIFKFYADSLRIEEGGGFDITDVDTTLSTGNFTSPLPRTIILAVAYDLRPDIVLTSALQQGLNRSMGNSTRPLISCGVEYSPRPYMPLRTGIALGGGDGFALGLGIGINLKFWQLNVGYLNHNFRWFRDARSVDLAVTTSLRF